MPSIFMPDNIILDNKGKWENTMVAYVMGRRPVFQNFERFVSGVMKPANSFTVYYKPNSFILIKFSNAVDFKNILKGGPYTINSRIIVLRKRSVDMKMTREYFTTIPIWVRLMDLNLAYSSNEGISRITSAWEDLYG